jgi:hypothetical protein
MGMKCTLQRRPAMLRTQRNLRDLPGLQLEIGSLFPAKQQAVPVPQ